MIQLTEVPKYRNIFYPNIVASKVHRILLGSALFELFEINVICSKSKQSALQSKKTKQISHGYLNILQG